MPCPVNVFFRCKPITFSIKTNIQETLGFVNFAFKLEIYSSKLNIDVLKKCLACCSLWHDFAVHYDMFLLFIMTCFALHCDMFLLFIMSCFCFSLWHVLLFIVTCFALHYDTLMIFIMTRFCWSLWHVFWCSLWHVFADYYDTLFDVHYDTFLLIIMPHFWCSLWHVFWCSLWLVFSLFRNLNWQTRCICSRPPKSLKFFPCLILCATYIIFAWYLFVSGEFTSLSQISDFYDH